MIVGKITMPSALKSNETFIMRILNTLLDGSAKMIHAIIIHIESKWLYGIPMQKNKYVPGFIIMFSLAGLSSLIMICSIMIKIVCYVKRL
jgi:hypothetical protein